MICPTFFLLRLQTLLLPTIGRQSTRDNVVIWGNTLATVTSSLFYYCYYVISYFDPTSYCPMCGSRSTIYLNRQRRNRMRSTIRETSKKKWDGMGWDGTHSIRFGSKWKRHVSVSSSTIANTEKRTTTTSIDNIDNDGCVIKRHQQLQHAPIRYGFAMQLE